MKENGKRGMKCYCGDIHNHCGASYAHGSLEDALTNARLQLDFASVTGHSSWPDMPEGVEGLENVVDYHAAGFAKLEAGWAEFVDTFDGFNEPGRFVCFPSYEIHSLAEGDYTVYLKDGKRGMFKPPSIRDFQGIIRRVRREGGDGFLMPHHIGYKTGYRGINWDVYDESVSPFIEVISMHGCSERDECSPDYLHTMGPRRGGCTMQAGLAGGGHFGVIGSTDHHSAHPGSHGYGRAGVWAEELTREGIWEALKNRRCFALTGDRIELDFRVNESMMGTILPYTREREISVSVIAGDALDCVDLLKNNRVLQRWNCIESPLWPSGGGASPGGTSRGGTSRGGCRGKLFIEAGWGEAGVRREWDIAVSVENGVLADFEPRLHGVDVVDPEQGHAGEYQFSRLWEHGGVIRLKTVTWGNPTVRTNANQGICVELDANEDTVVHVKVNGRDFSKRVRELAEGSEVFYLGGFLSGAVHLHRFVPEDLYTREMRYVDSDSGSGSGFGGGAEAGAGAGAGEDFYYVRVRQRNGQLAVSSPVWVRMKN